jgi:hypothetical protein
MARPRSSLKITEIKELFNTRIEKAPTYEARIALCLALESMLHTARCYHGFRYSNNVTPEAGEDHYYHFYF